MLPILDEFAIIPEHQFGFRRGHGTLDQCHRIINEIFSVFESKIYCTASFLDVQQAFDRVCHDGLLYKIKKCFFVLFCIIKVILNHETLLCATKNEYSPLHFIKAGVPQGSVLGPVLYTLYTADMPVTKTCTVATYADDTAILATSSSKEEASQLLQAELGLIESWFLLWKIKINAQKSAQITFALRRGDCPQSNCIKYLGLHLDRGLMWKNHIKATKFKNSGK